MRDCNLSAVITLPCEHLSAYFYNDICTLTYDVHTCKLYYICSKYMYVCNKLCITAVYTYVLYVCILYVYMYRLVYIHSMMYIHTCMWVIATSVH